MALLTPKALICGGHGKKNIRIDHGINGFFSRNRAQGREESGRSDVKGTADSAREESRGGAMEAEKGEAIKMNLEDRC
jgi:hypothetical protein